VEALKACRTACYNFSAPTNAPAGNHIELASQPVEFERTNPGDSSEFGGFRPVRAMRNALTQCQNQLGVSRREGGIYEPENLGADTSGVTGERIEIRMKAAGEVKRERQGAKERVKTSWKSR